MIIRKGHEVEDIRELVQKMLDQVPKHSSRPADHLSYGGMRAAYHNILSVLASAEEKDEWIDVKQRTPEYLVSDSARGFTIHEVLLAVWGRVHSGHAYSYKNGKTLFRLNHVAGEFDGLTHWMPLPAPPETKKEATDGNK